MNFLRMTSYFKYLFPLFYPITHWIQSDIRLSTLYSPIQQTNSPPTWTPLLITHWPLRKCQQSVKGNKRPGLLILGSESAPIVIREQYTEAEIDFASLSSDTRDHVSLWDTVRGSRSERTREGDEFEVFVLRGVIEKDLDVLVWFRLIWLEV